MKLCRYPFTVTALLIMLSTGAVLQAQTTGQITGSVVDASGAVIPAAQVTAIAVDTGQKRTTATDAKGSYVFLALQTGHYRLAISKPGFQTFEQTGVTIDVNSALVINAKLQIGTVVSTVSVEANPVQVETAKTQLGDVIDGTSIVSLPLNGRSYTDLLGLQPGVAPVSSGTTNPGSPYGGSAATGNVSVNGQREDSNGFLVNGGAVEESLNNGASIVPNLDSIAEFRVLTSTIDAENGHYSGGLVNVITKSGTNAFHGNVFDFLRNTDLDAKNYFDLRRGIFRQNQFGGTFGGPVYRNKAFFFVDYQGTRTTVGLSTGQVPAPSLAERTGDFSGLANSFKGSVGGQYFATYLSQKLGYSVSNGERYYRPGCVSSAQCVFPNAMIPSAAINPAAAGTLQFIPSPNSGSSFIGSANNQVTTGNLGSVRIDYNSERFGALSAYYFIDSYNQVTPFGTNNVPGFPTLDSQRPQSINLSDTKTFNPTTVNEFRFALTRFVANSSLPTNGFGKLSSLGFTEGGPGGILPADPRFEGVPEISFNNFTIGQPGVTYQRFETPPQFLDNFSKVIGNHLLKVGAEFDMARFHQLFPNQGGNGFFLFFGGETGIDFADYLIGATNLFIQASSLNVNLTKNYFGIYGEDSWRVRAGLTVNYGLRWDYIPNWYEKNNEASDTFVPGEQSKVYPTAPVGIVYAGDPRPGGGVIPRTVSNTPRGNFAPRIGIAYTPDNGKTSFRAAFGIFYTNNVGAQAYGVSGGPPFSTFSIDPAAAPFFDKPYQSRLDGSIHANAYPFTPPPPRSTNFDFSPLLPISGFPAWSIYNRTPYTEDYNFTIEREFRSNMVASLGYVGSESHALMDTEEQNPGNAPLCLSLSQPSEVTPGTPTCGPGRENVVFTTASGAKIDGTRSPLGPNFGSDVLYSTIGTASYNSLQASLRYRAKSLSFLAGYTWSKSLDDASASRFYILNPYDHGLSRGLSAYDIPQDFVISYNYVFPFGTTRHLEAKSIIAGWRLAGITRLASGLPVRLTEGDDRSLIGAKAFAGRALDTPNFSGGPLNFTDPRSRKPYFNTSLFSKETLGFLGTSRGSFFTGPGINNFDMSLIKDTQLSDRVNLEFRLEAFNVFNHAQFFNPSGNINSSSFGMVLGARSPRIGQVALKLNF